MTTEQYRSKSGFFIFLSFFEPHRGLFFLDMVCALIVALVDLAYPIISRYAMRTLLPQNAFGTFFLLMGIIAHLDTTDHTVALLSIPRDTPVATGNGGIMKFSGTAG